MGANDEHKAIIDGSQGNIRNAIDREVSAELQAEWEGILSRLRAEVGETAFQSWLRPMRVHCVDADVVQISVPTRFMRDWAAAHYEDRLTELWRDENAAITGVEIVVYADVADSKSAAVAKAEAEVQSVATIVRGRDTLSAPWTSASLLTNLWLVSLMSLLTLLLVVLEKPRRYLLIRCSSMAG